jgi:O-antigen/teichoic acid export membrane protein
MIFRDLGLNSAIVKFIPEFTVTKKFSNIRRMLALTAKIQFLLSLAIIATLWLLREYFAQNFFRNPASSEMVTVMLVFFFFYSFFQFFKSSFQGFQNMVLYALSEVMYIGLVFVSVAAIFSIFSPSALNAAYGYAAGMVAASVLCLMLLSNILFKQGPPAGGDADKNLLKDLMKFSFPVMITGMVSMLMGYIDTICVTLFRGMEEVGLYQAALPTSQIMVYLSTALLAILFPVIAEMWARKKYSSVSGGMVILIKFMLIVVLPVATVFVAFPETVLAILFGAKYVAAASALQILSISFVFYTMGTILTTIANSIGKPIINAKTIAVSSLLNLFLNIMLVPSFGIIGAAFSTLISYFIYFSMTKILLDREFKKINLSLKIPRIPALKILSGSVLAMLFIFLMKKILPLNSIPEVAAVLVLSLIVYGFWILLTGCIDKKDLKMMDKINIPLPKAARNFIGKYAR